MICYAVIDTNVLVSALLSSNAEAATVQLVARMIEGEIIRFTVMKSCRNTKKYCIEKNSSLTRRRLKCC